MLRAAAFIGIVSLGYILALVRGPYYGLLAYVFVYFIPPRPYIHWWASYIPFSRWSLLSSVVLIISCLLHRDKLVRREFRSANWLFIFIVLTVMITIFLAGDQPDAYEYTYKLVTYAITIWFIIKVVKTQEELRTFMFAIISLSGGLSIMAYLEGKRIHARLENIGTIDTFGSNEFGLLLASVIPFILPFALKGKLYEKLMCLFFLPFILNAFILCNSRGAAVAFILALIYAAFVIADNRHRKIIITTIAFSIPVFIYLTDAQFLERISSFWAVDKDTLNDESLSKLSSGRIEIWRYGLNMVEDYPLGAGPNSFKHLARFYMPSDVLTFHRGDEYGIRAAHNTYLQVLVEQGYVGLFIWLMMCLHTMLLLRSGALKLQRLGLSNSYMGLYMLALNISFVCSLAGGLVGSRVYYEFFWWQIALSVVAYSFVLALEKEANEARGLHNDAALMKSERGWQGNG